MLIFLSISCSVKKSESQNKIKDKGNPSKVITFDEYIESFNEISSLTVDSSIFQDINMNNPYSAIGIDYLTLSKLKEISELCGNHRKYLSFKVGKILGTKNSITLVYFLKLNIQCHYDGVENLFLLAKYNYNGSLISQKLIGKYYQVFGENEFIFFQIKDSKDVTMSRHYEFDSETGWVREQTIDSFKIK